MTEEIKYLLALNYIPGIGDVLAKQLISYCGSAEAIFKQSKGKLLKIPQIGEHTVQSILSNRFIEKAEAELAHCIARDVKVIPYFHSDYPNKLKLVNDAPLLIYFKGNISYNDRKVVGIVGTRMATEYGKEITSKIVKELVPHNALIVSGLAYGIDIAAHRAALNEGLDTVAVIAGGIDKIYPAVHKKTALDIQETGGVLTEQPLGTKPEAHYFPARNRIIAGMSDALIVVEAAKKGGALITANIAYSYNREVFAIPGDLNNAYSEGCNELIRTQKANIYTGVKDIEYLLNWEKGKPKISENRIDLTSLSEDERKVIEVLGDFKNGLQLDELSWKCQLAVNNVIGLLLNLEFAGFVKSLPGKKYQLVQ